MAPAVLQENSTVVQHLKHMLAVSPFEGVLLAFGIVLAIVGLSYFIVAATIGEREENIQSAKAVKSPGATTPSRSKCGTPDATSRLASPHKYSLAIPSVYDAPQEHSKKTDYVIKDTSGNKLLNVEVMRPFQDDDTDAGAPHEYVSLHSKDGEEELAMCALAPAGDGRWECNVYQGETELYGALVAESSMRPSSNMQFALISPDGERLLIFKGAPQERVMEVLDHNGATTAVVEPGNLSFGGRGEFYQAECICDADVGLIVLSLLAVDRLMSHQRR